MLFNVLGPLRVETRGGLAVPAGLQQRLVALLLLQANQPVPAGVLAEALWPDQQLDEATASRRLHLLAHRLRKSLGEADRIEVQQGYLLRVLPGELDVDRFDRLRREGGEALRAGDYDRAVERLRAAVELWRGEPYDGLGPAFGDERERLQGLRLSVLDDLYTADLERGGQPSVAELRDLAAEHPLRERFQALLMVALYDADRTADALEVYQQTERRLADELGLDPGPELRRVHDAIRAGTRPQLVGVEPIRVAIPAQLPPDVAGFAGRAAELASLNRLLVERAGVVVLSGTAGVGKTALVRHWAHLARGEFPGGQLYVDLRGFSTDVALDPADVLAGMLRALGLTLDDVPPSLVDRRARYRSLLADRRVLVVLDNARDVEQVRSLLPESPGAFTIITSREDLGDTLVDYRAARIGLAPMTTDESREVLRSALGDAAAAEAAAAEELIGICGGLPLALRIAAANARDGEQPVADIVAELQSEQRLDELAIVGDDSLGLRDAFAMSYDALDAPARRAFRCAGLVPGADFTPDLLAAASGLLLADVEAAMRRLCRAHLLDERSDGRYGMHDLVALYAAERADAEQSVAARAASMDRIFDHYLGVLDEVGTRLWSDSWVAAGPPEASPSRFPDIVEAAAWLDREHDNLIALVRAHSLHPRAWHVVHALRFHFQSRGDDEGKLALNKLALRGARAADDRVGQVQMLRGMSVACLLGNLARAAEFSAQALQIARQLADPYIEGLAWGDVASVHKYAGDLPAAIEANEESRRCYLEAGFERDAQNALANLAACHLHTGNLSKARRLAEDAYAYSTGQRDGRRRHSYLSLLADIDLAEGAYAEAVEHAELGQQLAIADGAARAAAYHQMTRGRALTGLGRFAEARDALLKARDELVRTGWLRAQVEVLEALAHLAAAEGNDAMSAGLLDIALSLARSSGHGLHATRIAAQLGGV